MGRRTQSAVPEVLGLATTQATRFLIRMYCRLLGEIKKLDSGKAAVYSRKDAEHKLATVFGDDDPVRLTTTILAG